MDDRAKSMFILPKTARQTRYTPSQASLLLDIRAKRAPKGPFTGAEFRPLIIKGGKRLRI